MDLSIIIVSYNVRDFLRGTIASVQRALEAGGLDGEILVVDNNSSDGSAEMVANELPDVTLYALKENLGFGRANNRALSDAKGDYFLLLNPDTIVGEDTLRRMVDFLRAHDDVGLAGCKLLNGDGSFQFSCRRGFPTPWASFCKLFGLARVFPHSKLFARYHLTYLPIDATYEVDAISGAFMMLSRQAYRATHGFDEEFFMYGEDLDLCFRVKKSGLKVYYVHDTATIHFKGESTRRSSINEVAVFYSAMHTFVKKNYGASPVFQLMLRLGILLRTLLAMVRKYRGAILSMVADGASTIAGLYAGWMLYQAAWVSLPAVFYPYALVVPPLLTIGVIGTLGAYRVSVRRQFRKAAIALPILIVALSSITYFFKEYPSSRQLVLNVSVMAVVFLVLNRIVLRIADRVRWGGLRAATPHLTRTLVVGTTPEAMRIAQLLHETEFSRGYHIVGLVDRTLVRLGEEVAPGLRILGDLAMIGKVLRDERISFVIFANDALSYAEMLSAMQRATSEKVAVPVRFSVVPTTSDVLIGPSKIELLTTSSQASVALVPLEYNLSLFSHRAMKRLVDLLLSSLGLLWYHVMPIRRSSARQAQLDCLREVFAGTRSMVGLAGTAGTGSGFAKPGMTSLAYISAGPTARASDVEQFDQYYVRNHTLSMDIEILVKTAFRRRDRP